MAILVGSIIWCKRLNRRANSDAKQKETKEI